MENFYYAYERISTSEERGLQKFDRQDKALDRYEQDHNIKFSARCKEDASGKNFIDRPEWNNLKSQVKAMAKSKENNVTIVFKELSRFTRECENGLKEYKELMNMGINLVFLDNPSINTDNIKAIGNVNDKSDNRVLDLTLDYIATLLLTVEFDRVEQERATIVKRIKQGIEASPKKSGRPVGNLDKISKELTRDIELYIKDRTIKQIDLMKKYNISRNTLKKYIAIKKAEQKWLQNS